MSLFIFPNSADSLPLSLVTRQSTRKDELKCHLDINQVENCLLSIFDLNDPHGTHCHRLDCDATFLSNISSCCTLTLILNGSTPRGSSAAFKRTFTQLECVYDGRTDSKETRLQRIGKKVRLVRHGVGPRWFSQILPHVYYHVTVTILRSRRHAGRSLVHTGL